MEIIEFFKRLVEAFFGAFAKAVMDYPFTTAIILAAVATYIHNKEIVVIIRNGRLRTSGYSIGDIVNLIVFFIIAIILSFFIGYIFNVVTGLITWLFGAGMEFVSPFKKDPISFSLIFIFLSIAALIWLYAANNWNIKSAQLLQVFYLSFAVLFTTYVITSMHIAINSEKTDKSTNK